MSILLAAPSRSNAADLRLVPYKDGVYLVEPFVPRVDELIRNLRALGLQWDADKGGFWCPVDRLNLLMRYCFVHGLRTRRTA